MNLDSAINIEDLHRMARRKLPRIIFDYIEGGVEDERGLARNEAAFHKHRLLPRYLVDVSKRDQSATVFGRTYSSPFGISPTGGVGLYRREGEVMLAEAAAAVNIPYIMSGGSNASMEEAARVAPNNVWFQLYAAKDGNITDALIGRAREAYEARRRGMVEALAALGIEAHGNSGLNVWVPVREEAVTVRALQEAGWLVLAGERLRIATRPGIRITITTLRPGEDEAIAAAIAAVEHAARPRRVY